MQLQAALSDEELEYAIRKAWGIIIGYAMEYRAKKILEELGFKDIKLVDAPTHDLEATLNGEKVLIEVKSAKSPTRSYSANKILLISKLNNPHYTLIVRSNGYELKRTEEILSPPKRLLLELLRAINAGDQDKVNEILSTREARRLLQPYKPLIIREARGKGLKLKL